MLEKLMPCRILADSALAGDDNMRIDAEMLADAVNGIATLRTYQWNVPTISLGHFQVAQDQAPPQRFADLPIVRRLSGGGAILHHYELTYSIALPRTHPVTTHPSRLYNIIHECIIDLLSDQGIDSQLRGDAAFGDKPFLCFGRGDERDIVVGDYKIVGSAQRRRQGAVLQHGSILLSASPYAPEFPGIAELTGVQLDLERAITSLQHLAADRLQLQAIAAD